MESDYDRKFEEMKKYIPFLESMIRRLESTNTGTVNPRQAQLSKIRALRDLLLDKNKRMKMENLLKCEQVLVNLYAKVETRDTLPGIQKAKQSVSPPRKKKSPPKDLEAVRRKLKATTVQENEETLPEIARANQTEVDCIPGSKEPALFQRRPNKASPPKQTNAIQDESSTSKRNYTRVLVSPPRSDRRWSTSEDQIIAENHLFHRRSPKKSPHKKEKKKSFKHDKKLKSDNNLNITLNVPEESMHSLNTEDIFDRIINCDNTDVDIGTLRDLRSQILSELKQTGANEDISDLIMKSYRNKNNKSKPLFRKKPDVEEGELSDSESEAIENIYGSLVIADGDKESGKCKETTANSKNSDLAGDSRKIQIHLVISNSNKDKPGENTSAPKAIDNTNITNDSNSSSLHLGKGIPQTIKQLTNVLSESMDSSREIKLNATNDELLADEAPLITVNKAPKTSNLFDFEEKSTETKMVDNECSEYPLSDDAVAVQSVTKNVVTRTSESTNDSKTVDKKENKANFYKSVEIVTDKSDHTKINANKDKILAPEEYLENVLSSTNDKEDEKKDVKCDSKPEESVKIPFLTEPSTNINPLQENKNVISQIDILQALKNEILSENLAIPGAEATTPALHQPKLTKVANAQEIAVKKKISLENYKKKSAQKPLYQKETPLFGSKKRDEVSQVPSRGLTTKELERFKSALLALGDSSEEEEDKSDRKEKDDGISIDDVYGDLAPQSPDMEISSDIGNESLVIIPEDPVKAPAVESKGDVDMRKYISKFSPQSAQSSPLAANELAPYKPPIPNINRHINEPSLPRPSDPRKRRDFNPSLNNDHSNSPHLLTPSGTPRPMPNFVNMTPNRPPNMVPNMTPSRASNMTPSMTQNARTFEMTPSHSFEFDEQSSNHKHVYAPVTWETCDRDTAKDTSSPRWEPNESRSGSSAREGPPKQNSSRWGDRDPRNNVIRDETSDPRDKFQQRRDPRLNNDRRDDGYSRSECPPTPSHYFGRGDYPSTPTHPFGMSEGPMTPVHPFGRSDKLPTTPSHPFGSGDSPSTPSHQFGRSEMPMTPSHPFGRSDCPATPNHPFGRSDYPTTPSHPFGRSDCPATPSHPFSRSGGYTQDPRCNRNANYNHDDDRGYSKDRNALNYNRNKHNRYTGTIEAHQRFGRERSVGRNDHGHYIREQSIGRNDENYYHREPNDRRRPNVREPSVGRTRDASNGRTQEPSLGRMREHSVGRMNKENDDSKDYQHGRRSGHESRLDSGLSGSYEEVGTRRERSVGRTLPSDQNIDHTAARASSPSSTFHDRPADNTVSVESHAGRSFTIDTSVNATFQAFDFTDEASRMFDARKKRAASVGRSFNRESSVGRSLKPDSDIEHQKAFFANKNHSNFTRACSVGRDLVNSRPEKSFKDIKADLEAFKTKEVIAKNARREKSVDKGFGRNSPMSIEKTEAKKSVSGSTRAPNNLSTRDPRSRKDIYDAHRDKAAASGKKDTYSPRKNDRDPRMRRDKYTTSSKYKIDYRHRDQQDNKIHGIVYTNEAIAKGNILGPGYGVKNYKIPKIKRPPDEIIARERDLSQSENEKDKNSIEIKGASTPQNNEKEGNEIKKTKLPKDKSDLKTKTSKTSEVVDQQVSDDVSPVRTRRTRKSVIVYSDIDSDSDDHIDNTKTKQIQQNVSPVENRADKKSEQKAVSDNKELESNVNDSLDFFGIQDEELSLFTENIASDTVIDNINELIADLDKDIGTSKSNEGIMTDNTKDSILENILESLTSAENTNFMSDSIQDESLKQQVMKTIAKEDDSCQDLNKAKESNKLDIFSENNCEDTKQNIISKVSQKSDIQRDGKEKVEISSHKKSHDVSQAIEPVLPLPQLDTDVESVSTSIPEVNDGKNIEEKLGQNTREDSEACSTPDSTINTEDNISQPKTLQDKPDSTNGAQTEMNSDISSTHDSTDVSNKEVVTERSSCSDPVIPNSDSLGSILSLLKDKSKIKELLSMLNDQSDNEKLKKKLEKLSEIVSDDEDSADKNMEAENETAEKNLDLESKPETKLKYAPEEDTQAKQQLELVDINEPKKIINMKENEDEKCKKTVDQTTKEMVEEAREHKTDDIDEIKEDDISDAKGDQMSKYDDIKNFSSDDEADDELITKRSQSRTGKKILKRGRKGRWKKKLNKSKVQINEGKRVTRSEASTKQAKPAKKISRELQLLQDDIRDMFISDEVLNATGIRMCRLAKLVEDKNKILSSESSPTKTNESGNRSDADLRDNIEPKPLVVLEKMPVTRLEPAPPKPLRKKPRPKPKPKPVPEKQIESKRAEKPKPIPAYRPGPKSKTKVQAKHKTDPYEFEENDSVSEATTKTSENTPFNSDSDSESLSSYKSCGSTEPIVEKKPRAKKRRSKWQMGVIQSKKAKKNANKSSPRLTIERDPTPEPISTAQVIEKVPDMECFTDKGYCFTKSTSTYSCRLCVFKGDSIVHHYKKEHPHYEIPLSRMHPRTAFEAIKQSITTNFQEISKVPVAKYVCRFCTMVFEDKRKAILEEFFWHVVSTHTGEYKQLCSECLNVKKCTFMLDIPPPPKDVKGLLMGYICGKCHYTQVSLENLKNHVSLRHNDEETEVYTISLGMMTQKMVETLKMQAIEDSSRTPRSLRSKNSSISDENPAPELEIKNRKPRGPKSAQSKIQFESDTASDQQDNLKTVVKTEAETVSSQNRVPSFENTIKDQNEVPAPDLEDEIPETATSERTPSEIEKSAETTKESIQNDVFVDPHFKINYTEHGNKEYLCCIHGQDHYKTTLLISIKKHVQIKHARDVWDGYCSVCKVIVTSQGIHSFKDCLAHLLDKHSDDFPILEKRSEELSDVQTPLPEKSDNSVTNCRRESPLSYIHVRPMSELISKQPESDAVDTEQDDTSIALPRIESVVSLNVNAMSNSPVVEQPEENPITDTNTYDEPAVAPKEIIEIDYEEVQKEVMAKKHRIVLDTMMALDKLAHVFKCAGRYCSFTCASTEDALVHASTHQRVGGEDALICTYCSFDAAGNAIDLVSHVFKEHGACQFSCKSCFYRAITSTLVEAHFIRVHGIISPGAVLQATIITSFLKRADESEGLLSRQEAVKHYVCCSDAERCKFKTFTHGKFMEHLLQKHPDVRSHDCNECPYIASNANDLLQHLQSHGLKLYQCTWCVFGADTENEMLGHASIKHPMKRPQAYLRHIIESKDGSSVPKFKVLPFVHISKKTAIAPVEVPLGTKPDNPVREAERALELEKLIGHTDQMIQNFASDSTESPLQTRVTVLEQEEPIDSPTIPSATSIENQPPKQIEVIPEPPRQVTPLLIDRELPVSERATPQLKLEATQETSTEDKKASHTQNRMVSDVVYCLDSDEDDSNQRAGVIDISDDNDSYAAPLPPVNQTTVTDDKNSYVGPLPPVDQIIATDNSTTQRYPWLQLFKCSKCNTTFKTGNALKRHLPSCFPYVFDVIPCFYCPFKTQDKSKMVEHYFNQHGQLDKYTCDICKHEETSSKLIRKHFGMVHGQHKLGFQIVKKEKKCMEYMVKPLSDTPKPRGRRKRSNNDQPSSAPPAKIRRYGPEDINLLPINQIFDEPAQCLLCEFSTKVRQNLIRHLQLHSQQQSVPQIAPVNPVPHLETNEMHFDRMLNLASSSNANKANDRSSRPESETIVAVHVPPEAAARYPKYITERQRYACGAKDCSYISIDEAMLKCHWETLHSGSNDYHCVHCPANQQLDTSRPLTAARIIAHLKMHDVKLFSCSACLYYHHQQHILEKHLTEKHNGNAQLKVVRGPSTAPPTLAPTQPVTTAPTMDLKPWQCGLCKFKSMLRPDVIDHCSKQHQSKFQYKCAFCPWRSSTLENVTKHHSHSHGQLADIFYFYYREGSISDESDGTPRWMKQRLKAGLPVEHEVKTETVPPTPETPTVSTPLTIQPPPAVSVDLNIVKCEIPEPSSPKQDRNTIEDLCKKFGNFCDPNGIRYKCSLCKQTMEDTKEAMQSHLYEELKYRKWGCSICSYKAFHKKGLKEHASQEHRRNLEPLEVSSDKQIETWVAELLKHQETIIKNNLANFKNQKIATPEKNKPSTFQPQGKKDEVQAEENVNLSKHELTELLGHLGVPKHLMFSCPKCDTQIKEESKMNEHLEMELSKVRWCCSNCPEKFQHYHQAQLHCKTVHVGQSARAVEAVRDPNIRSAWIAAVIQVQKLSMNIMPVTSVTSGPHKSALTEKQSEQEPAENSLLVVRYEEDIPNPETSKPTETFSRRKRPGFMGDQSDDDDENERLIIDEEPEKQTDGANGIKCPYCEFRTMSRSTVNAHILRHYNLKPYRCDYCDFNAYNQTVSKHIEKCHPGRYPRMTKVKVPDTPPTEIKNIAWGRASCKRKSKDHDAVFCLYCVGYGIFTEPQTHTHPNRTPQFARLGENILKCNNCATFRKDSDSMNEHYELCHPGTTLDISNYVINEDQERTIVCSAKRCHKTFSNLEELKSHNDTDHPGQPLNHRTLPVTGHYQAVPVEASSESASSVSYLNVVDSVETSDGKKTCDSPAVESRRFAKKSTTKLPFMNAVAKKSTTKLPFHEQDSDGAEEEYSYYGTKPPCLDSYANISTIMATLNSKAPVPVKLPALRAIVNIAPKLLLKDINKQKL